MDVPEETGHPQVLVVTGMSGAGRSTAAKVLEDLGYTVIDNLPPDLITAAIDRHAVTEDRRRLAVVVYSRAGVPPTSISGAIDQLDRQGIATLVVFLDAEDAALIQRYEENRRPHPVGGQTLADAIADERAALAELRDLADVVIDTTDLNVHELRHRISDLFSEEAPGRPMRVSVTSFGFKHGIPRDADLLFDVRFLPNPHWVAELRSLPGTDPAVYAYVVGDPDAREFLDRVEGMLDFLIPRYQAEGKSYLSIGIGCTGGHHRSVALSVALERWLEGRGIGVTVRHRDVAR